jgi:hypothetical protein
VNGGARAGNGLVAIRWGGITCRIAAKRHRTSVAIVATPPRAHVATPGRSAAWAAPAGSRPDTSAPCPRRDAGTMGRRGHHLPDHLPDRG